MASLGVEKPTVGYSSLVSTTGRKTDRVLALLRFFAILATLSATAVMALNKETNSIVVATIGTTPIKATVTAKFQDTPANMFFVVANGLATIANMVVLGIKIFRKKLDINDCWSRIISIIDTITVAILSSGASSAAFMAQLAKNGNSHAAWNKICDKYESFCNQGGGAILGSFIALGLMLALNVVTVARPKKQISSAAIV